MKKNSMTGTGNDEAKDEIAPEATLENAGTLPSGGALVPYRPALVPLNEHDALTIAYQVTSSVPAIDSPLKRNLEDDAVGLYASVGPQDAVESVLTRWLGLPTLACNALHAQRELATAV